MTRVRIGLIFVLFNYNVLVFPNVFFSQASSAIV